MMRAIVAAASLVLFYQTSLVFGQSVSDGQCAQVPTVQDFDVQRYVGRWYGYKSYSNLFQQNSTCNTIDYTDSTAPCCRTKVSVLNRSLNSTDGSIGNATGVAHLAEPNNAAKPGSFIVNFYEPVSKEFQVDPNYLVLKTDYESYAIVYSCRPKDCNTKTEFLWVLSRVRQPADPAALDMMIYETLQDLAIDETRLQPVVQTACPEELNRSVPKQEESVPVAPVTDPTTDPATPIPVSGLFSLVDMGPLVSYETVGDQDSEAKRHKWAYLRREKATWEQLTRL